MAKYKITIEKTETVRKTVSGKWVQVGVKPASSAALLQTAREPEYGYAPDREEEVTERKTIYEQTVEELNLIRVIEAVNNQ